MLFWEIGVLSLVICVATSQNSVNQYLANFTDALNGNRISIDSIYFYQDGAKKELPKKTGFWKGIMASISRFFYSFTSQAYSTSNADPSHLQVWVNRSRQHLEIMQKIIDEDFTPKTGIVVDLSLMPDQNKLVLANASGDAPDIASCRYIHSVLSIATSLSNLLCDCSTCPLSWPVEFRSLAGSWVKLYT